MQSELNHKKNIENNRQHSGSFDENEPLSHLFFAIPLFIYSLDRLKNTNDVGFLILSVIYTAGIGALWREQHPVVTKEFRKQSKTNNLTNSWTIPIISSCSNLGLPILMRL